MAEFSINNGKILIKKRHKPVRPYIIGLFVIALGLAIFFALPFVLLLMMSLVKDQNEILSYPPIFISDQAYFVNYATAFVKMDFMKKLGNTLLIMVSSTALSLFSSILVAYGFARFQNKVSNIFFMILLSTMMLPWVVTMIPAFAEFQFLQDLTGINWTRSPLPLIVPAIGGSAFNVFMIRQFMVGIPKDLDEAAKMDGCSTFGVLWRIIVPQLKPVIATLLVYSFMSGWSDYIGPSIYLQGAKNWQTLALGIQGLITGNGEPQWHIVFAASVMYSIPLILVISVCQKAFVRGQVGSAIK